MAINRAPINSYAINASDGQPLTGGGTLVSIEQSIFAAGAGTLISIEQNVGKIGVGTLISIEQNLIFQATSGTNDSLISIEQDVVAQASGTLINVQQKVKQLGAVDNLSRMGWDATLTVGGAIIPQSKIHGSINIVRTENAAALMDVTLLADVGVFDLNKYAGKDVTLDITTDNGIFRAYTGSVDIPELDLIDEKITLRCTDKRTELINDQLAGKTNTVGVYSSKIFAEPEDVAQEIEQRLTTVPYNIDFDAYGNFNYTPWAPKATADYTLTDSDVYRNEPRVEFSSRGRLTNQVVIKFKYRYQRFYHAERSFQWTSPIRDNNCLLFIQGYSLTAKAAVVSAIESAGWPVKGNISWTAIPAAGWYRCGVTPIAWAPAIRESELVPLLDEEGNPVKGPDGETRYTTKLLGATDYSALFCVGASWTAATQWSQYVNEDITLTMNAPQSQAQYGIIEQEKTYGIEQESDSDEWEDFTSFSSVGGSNNYYVDQDINRAEFNTAMTVALAQAKTTLLDAHRDTRVIFSSFVKPEIDLKHTVLVDTDLIEAKGKVYSVNHSLNIGTGEAVTKTTLQLSQSSGSTTTSALTLPSKPSDSVTLDSGPIRLGNHFGEDPTKSSAARWTGMVGNKWITESGSSYKTTYLEQFIVDVPKVADQYRDTRNLAGSASYDLEIPNDTLTITFDGKS